MIDEATERLITLYREISSCHPEPAEELLRMASKNKIPGWTPVRAVNFGARLFVNNLF
ncbi:MAG: hypothetical protein P8075_18460 [Deltaproteobacteria bacterium]|jgi:hypothetical protein